MGFQSQVSDHGVELWPSSIRARARESNFWDFKVQCPLMESNFRLNGFEPQAKRLTFACKMTALSANLLVLAGKLHYVTFGVITRNITRLIKTPISR